MFGCKEKEIQTLLSNTNFLDLIDTCYIFGSCANNTCTNDSDIDFYIETNHIDEVYFLLVKTLSSGFDALFKGDCEISSRMMKSILSGIKIK